MGSVTILRDHSDVVAASLPVDRALERLRVALSGRGVSLQEESTPEGLRAGPIVEIAGPTDTAGRRGMESASLPIGSEAFTIVASKERSIARGSDVRGLVYAVRELADRVEHGHDPVAALRPDRPIVGRPASPVRSVARLFCSEVEDLGWYRDEGFWRRYLSMLVSQRFNRVSLTLGLGYNYHRGITDAYLYFAYPFLLGVPEHGVRVRGLPDEERERNLAALRSASDEAAAVGLEFQLGLWTHAYQWIDSPDAHHTIEGLVPKTHAAYCRDAVGELLDRCPAISGLTFRIHGESGIPERSWDFWRTVFEGVRDTGREIRLDLHAKGLDEPTLSSALATGQPVTVSPKFWAEHMGLPYHQAAIRELERGEREDPSARSEWHRYMSVSEGSRPFTRYGYGDFLREDRPYDVVFRLWAGTQRLLLWGDPAFAAAYGRVSTIAGTQGLEWCEPLTFKGREGTGVPGSRTGYADASLIPTDDWAKFAHTYRLLGRLSYDPEASPETWQRALRSSFGEASADAEAALSAASKILPLVTTAHHPSASNNYFWPEMYTDFPIVWTEAGARSHPYFDTPEPRRSGTTSPLDPEVFSSVSQFVSELLSGEPSGRVSPPDVASWLERWASEASLHADAVGRAVERPDAEVRRWLVDIMILSAMGRFFAGKTRAAIGYELFTATGNAGDLEAGVGAYRSAVAAWHELSNVAHVYVDDLTFGPEDRLRGHWRDRLEAIEVDLGDMEELLAEAPRRGDIATGGWDRPQTPRPNVEIIHSAPETFRPGEDLSIAIEIDGVDAEAVDRITLRYRPMNQALPIGVVPLERSGRRFSVRIPGPQLDGLYPLAYAFVLTADGIAWRHPGLGDDLASQPYLVVRPRRTSGEGAPRA